MAEEEGTVRLNLRLPAELHRRLQETAQEHHRSLNSEILDRLGKSFDEDQQEVIYTERRLTDRVQELEYRMASMIGHSPAFGGGMVVYVPQDAVDSLTKTTKGGNVSDLYDEVIRRIRRAEERRDEGAEG